LKARTGSGICNGRLIGWDLAAAQYTQTAHAQAGVAAALHGCRAPLLASCRRATCRCAHTRGAALKSRAPTAEAGRVDLSLDQAAARGERLRANLERYQRHQAP
jgi:hypothetical protein